jgi:hypothetical protein
MTKVSIWNQAVAIIGGGEYGLIQGENDESSQAKWCRELWDAAVDHSIIALEPNEAKAYTTCSETAYDIEKADWGYAYTLPADFLHFISFVDESGRELTYEYDIISGLAGNIPQRFIVSDESSCYIKYLRKLSYDSTDQYSPELIDVIAHRLAVMIVPVFVPSMKAAVAAEYSKSLHDALGNARSQTYIEKTEWITDLT